MLKKLFFVAMLLFVSNLFGKNFELVLTSSLKKVLSSNHQVQLLQNLQSHLKNGYIQTVDITLSKEKNFEMQLLRKNKTFLKEYTIAKQLDGVIILKYKRSSNSVIVRLYLNDASNSEVINYALVGRDNFKNKSFQINNIEFYGGSLSINSVIIKNLLEANVINIAQRRI